MRLRNTTVALLTVIAVLLALNLVVKGTGEAKAQVAADGQPYVVNVAISPGSGGSVQDFYRFWSDGQVDYTRVIDFAGCGYEPYAEVLFGPSGHSAPLRSGSYNDGRVALHYEDGRIDYRVVGQDLVCTVFGEGGGFACIGDTDRNGVTDFQDIINVLEDWGECRD